MIENNCKECPCKCRMGENIDDSSLEELGGNHVAVSFKKGDAIIKQGTYSTNIAYLRKGMVKIHIQGPSYEQIVKIKKAPTYLGLPTTFAEKVNQYGVTAISDAEVCFIDINVFKDILKNNDKFSYAIIVELCKDELESYIKCANRTQKQSRGNIAGVLLDMSDNIFNANRFTCPITQSEIGNLVDATRESVSRVLSEFHKDGLISMSGKNVEILNKPSLEIISKNG